MNARIIMAMGFAATTLAVAGRRAAEPTPPEWKLREELRLGADAGPDDDLLAVRGLVVSAGGTVYALDRGEIRVFAPRARPRRLSLPRPPLPYGTGPGAPPVAIGSVGDRLWVLHPPRTVTVIDTAGTVLRQVPFRGDPSPGPGLARELLLGDSTFIALLADGSFLRTMPPPSDDDGRPPPARLYVLPLPAPADTSVQATTLLVRAGDDGEALQGLEVLAGAWSDARIVSPYGHVALVPQPFQDHPLVAVAPGGTEVAVVERHAAQPGRAAYSVIRFSGPSWKRTAHRFPYDPAPITALEVDSAVQRIVDGSGHGFSGSFLNGFPSRAAATARVRSVIRRPASHAPVTDVVVGADRTVWLRERRTGRWRAHTHDGRIAGSVVLPAGARLLYAADRTLWAAVPLSGEPRSRQALVRYRLVEP